MPDEQALVAAIRAGDAEAFSELVRAHQARVRLICLTFLGNREEADDAAQETFVKAFQSLAEFRGEASFETWVARIAENHCRDLLRRRQRQPAESLEALLQEKGDAFEGLLTRAQGTEAPPALTANELDLLARLFAALSTEDREILALREIEQLSYEEIAHRTHLSLDAVKSRLKRARQTLTAKCRKFL